MTCRVSRRLRGICASDVTTMTELIRRFSTQERVSRRCRWCSALSIPGPRNTGTMCCCPDRARSVAGGSSRCRRRKSGGASALPSASSFSPSLIRSSPPVNTTMPSGVRNVVTRLVLDQVGEQHETDHEHNRAEGSGARQSAERPSDGRSAWPALEERRIARSWRIHDF